MISIIRIVLPRHPAHIARLAAVDGSTRQLPGASFCSSATEGSGKRCQRAHGTAGKDRLIPLNSKNHSLVTWI